MDRQYVGIDFHRRLSVIVRKSSVGEKLSSVRVPNDAPAIAAAMADAGAEPEVVIEATYGWYWIVDWLQEQGATVHLANPSGLPQTRAELRFDAHKNQPDQLTASRLTSRSTPLPAPDMEQPSRGAISR